MNHAIRSQLLYSRIQRCLMERTPVNHALVKKYRNMDDMPCIGLLLFEKDQNFLLHELNFILHG